jgi:glutaredoxin
MDKIPIIIIAIIIVLAGVLLIVYNNNPLSSEKIFFYSLTCPHCKNVEDFVAQNNIQDKVKFTNLEVSKNLSNAQLLVKVGKYCKLSGDNIGAVPLFWDGSKCILGDVDIINFFKNAANIQ